MHQIMITLAVVKSAFYGAIDRARRIEKSRKATVRTQVKRQVLNFLPSWM